MLPGKGSCPTPVICVNNNNNNNNKTHHNKTHHNIEERRPLASSPPESSLHMRLMEIEAHRSSIEEDGRECEASTTKTTHPLTCSTLVPASTHFHHLPDWVTLDTILDE